ncbi:MAG: bifunctional ornithine acetyltransferase/N-acetylglutamate synthase, partial [Rhodospirillales bacterium]|nr:bifunctional ornithine acetyltransferase/N-acetylglutamate synthase [Rhodospirillales bacterium]
MKAETPIAAASSPGAVALAAGFSVGVAKAGIKPGSDRLDVALLVCDGPAVAAGVFTQNQVRAEPVRFCETNLARRKPMRAVLVNSGNANACTGRAGKVTVRDSAAAVARALGCKASEVLLASTGVIGVPLPTERLVAGVSAAAAALATGADAGHAGARAIMTTDSRAKEYAVRLRLGGKTVTVGGMAKGAGMIHPNMATMLAFITTDAVLSQSQAQRLLADVVEDTFNSITVDGDTSTNDTLLLLA